MNIIPIKKNSKKPAINWKEYQTEKFPRKELLLYAGLNKAVICGDISDGLVILDFDFEGQPYFVNILKVLKRIKTFIVQTPHGIHIYFRINGKCPKRQTQIPAKLPELKHFDILGNLGYALVPPSTIDNEFYTEVNQYPVKKISREFFDKIVEIFREKNSEDEAVPNLTIKLSNLREPLQEILRGNIEIEEIAHKTGKKEFLYWKAVFLETRANGIPDDIIMGFLAKTQPAFDSSKSLQQLRHIAKNQKPYTNITLFKLFPENMANPILEQNNEGWVDIARDLMDSHDIISMEDTKQLMIKKGNIYTESTADFYEDLGDQLIDMFEGKSYKHKRTAILQLIEDVRKFDRKKFCYDRWVINFENGYYDIKMNKFFPAQEDTNKIFCYEIPHEYKKGRTDCPYFKQLLIEWLGKNNVIKPNDIFEMIGYTMTMTTHLKMAFMIYGKPNTGKTAFQNILSHIIGIRNISGTPLHRFGSNEFGTDNLQFKILNMVGDMGETVVEELSIFKNLTGGDIWVHAEYKGGKKFEFRNMVKIWNNVNFVPRIVNTHDEAFYNRWTLIPFPNVFEMFAKETIKEIWELVNGNDDEIQGILHECIKGCKRLIARNEYFRKEIIENTKHIWEYESDKLYAFIYDKCIIDSEGEVSANEFKNEFNKYLFNMRRKQVTPYVLKNMMEAKGYFKDRSTYIDSDGTREYYFGGLNWRTEERTSTSLDNF